MDDTAHRSRRRLPEIKLPSGKTLVPRKSFAHNEIGTSEKTAIRMDLPTAYIGGVAYVEREGSLEIVGEKVHRRNQPPTTRRRKR